VINVAKISHLWYSLYFQQFEKVRKSIPLFW